MPKGYGISTLSIMLKRHCEGAVIITAFVVVAAVVVYIPHDLD